MKTTTMTLTLALGLMFCFVIQANAAMSFIEDFSDNSPNPNMALGTGAGSPTTNFTGDFTITSGDSSRIYLGTNDTDYSLVSFVFEATVIMTGDDSPWDTPFFGMGDADATAIGSPTFGAPGTPNAVMTLRPDSTDRIRSIDNGVGADQQTSAAIQNGTHRLRMEWNANSGMAAFLIDKNYTGTFASDFSFTLDGSTNGFTAANSQLFVGGGGGVTFDDISVHVLPEPSAILLMGLGIVVGVGAGGRRRRRTRA